MFSFCFLFCFYFPKLKSSPQVEWVLTKSWIRRCRLISCTLLPLELRRKTPQRELIKRRGSTQLVASFLLTCRSYGNRHGRDPCALAFRVTQGPTCVDSGDQALAFLIIHEVKCTGATKTQAQIGDAKFCNQVSCGSVQTVGVTTNLRQQRRLWASGPT